MIGGMNYIRFGVVTLAAVVAAPMAARSQSPVGADQTRWWGHVSTLADDSLEGRQTGTDRYRQAASHAAEQFERAGLNPAGTKGYLQTIQFMRRRIVEAQSHVALVRGRTEDVLRLGEDVTISLRAELAPSGGADGVRWLRFSAPDAGHDDLAGLDLRVRSSSSSTERRRPSPARRRRIIRTGPSDGRRSRPRAPSALSRSSTPGRWSSRGSEPRRAV